MVGDVCLEVTVDLSEDVSETESAGCSLIISGTLSHKVVEVTNQTLPWAHTVLHGRWQCHSWRLAFDAVESKLSQWRDFVLVVS